MMYASIHQCRTDDWSAANASKARSVRHVGIVLFDGFSLLSAGAVAEVFGLANELSAAAQLRGRPAYHVRFLSPQGGCIRSSSQILVWSDGFDGRYDSALDAIFIAGGEGAIRALADARLAAWLRSVCLRTDIIIPMAEGNVLLGAAGVTATWTPNCEEGVDERYAPVKAALDMVRRELGIDSARDIAERLLPAAGGKLSPLFLVDGKATVRDQVRAAARWLEENCVLPVTVPQAARVASMSDRTFLRRFVLEMGKTPSEYLLQARLDMACQLLRQTDIPIDTIARRCGMTHGDRLAKIFRKRMGITASEYRASGGNSKR
jgi:transcriptional regulator GlxA family with amidase domain